MIIVYFLKTDGTPGMRDFTDAQLGMAMTAAADFRAEGMRHVSISSEPGDMVGGFGVNAVVDGKTPDGHDYDWSKAGRDRMSRNPDRDIWNDGVKVVK